VTASAAWVAGASARIARTAIPHARSPAALGIAPQTAERARGHTLGRSSSGPLHGWFLWTKESSGARIRDRLSRFRGRMRDRLALCASGLVQNLPSSRDGAATVVATHRVRDMSVCTRRDASNRTNRRPGGPQCHPHRPPYIRHASPLPWTATAHDLGSAPTPAEPRRSTAWSSCAASCQFLPTS
jgi:hypothetical protein